MSRIRQALLVTGALVALLLVYATPVQAYASVEEARDAIYATADAAVSDMQNALAAFEQIVFDLDSESQITAATNSIQAEVADIWSTARHEIDQIKNEFPNQLTADASAAKTMIQEVRLEASAQVGDLKGEAIAMLGTASTTTTTATTTTTTTTPEPIVGFQGPPPPETKDPTPVQPPTPVEAVPETGDPSIALVLPPTPMIESAGETAEVIGSRVAQQLEVILPPAIARFVVTPLVIAEVLLRTILEGGRFVAVPLGLLVVASGALLLWAQRRKAGVDPEALTAG